MNGEGASASSRGCAGLSVDKITMTEGSSRVNQGGKGKQCCRRVRYWDVSIGESLNILRTEKTSDDRAKILADGSEY